MLEVLTKQPLAIEQVLFLVVFAFVVLKESYKYWRKNRKPRVREPNQFKPRQRTARVKRVLDRDTVIVSNWLAEDTIRLDGIDCPESGQAWGNNAKYGLVKLIGGKSVRIEEQAIDKYGRIVAGLHVWAPDKQEWIDVNGKMIVRGHAWLYRDFISHLSLDRRRDLERMEGWARRKRVGLWRHPNPVPPWNWRNSGS